MSEYFGWRRFLSEFVYFVRRRKLVWMTPILVVLLLLAGLIFFAESAVLSPFLYALF
ncbi:MAG: DUF5989 family protein [Candidatus Lernaella stagnicola]|nr:DUF5989 family protein [Candidatus Lernaella stagnicola]